MKSKAVGVLMMMMAVAFVPPALGAPPDEASRPLRSDSRSPYVHRITLYDEDGTAISPEDMPPAPYSPRATCGKCHGYGIVGSGWHFSAGEKSVDAGRRGEPWMLSDPLTGTQLPISARGRPGTYAPEVLGMTAWRFVLAFGRHLPGGGIGEPEPSVFSKMPEAARWRISGTLGIDCMLCHSGGVRHDPSEANRQIERQNLKWIPTVAMGLASVRGEARKAPDDWDPFMPPDPDHPERAGPSMRYDKTRFDADDRVLFDVAGKPSNARCYFCHTSREVGPDSPEGWQVDQDVHLSAGLGCVDCHRHGLDHAMVRGYEGENTAHAAPTGPSLTCRGCHLGDEGADAVPAALGGRFGAPKPLHSGLPPVHLDKLVCTACHSGPWPTGQVRRFQTSRAHGLGVASKERTDVTPPEILGPVFVPGSDGKLAPHYMVWPAFWGRMAGDEIKPIAIEAANEAVATALPERSAKTHGGEALDPEQVASVLAALAESGDPQAVFVYVSDGRAHRRDASGTLETFEHPVAGAYTWPVAHDVRPAAQSLGSGGCTDCHAADAPFSFGRITPVTAAQGQRPVELMYELRGQSSAMLQAWATSFVFRMAFKVIGFACAAVLGWVLLVYGLRGTAALLKFGR